MKTLKDIKQLTYEQDGYRVKDLREVASKWVKIFEDMKNRKRNDARTVRRASAVDYIKVDDSRYITIDENVVKWIKFFFNLEDE